MWKTVRMASDLGSEANQVHRAEIAEAADEVLRFWLVDTPADKHFAADPAFDAEIGRRFGDLHETLARDGATREKLMKVARFALAAWPCAPVGGSGTSTNPQVG